MTWLPNGTLCDYNGRWRLFSPIARTLFVQMQRLAALCQCFGVISSRRLKENKLHAQHCGFTSLGLDYRVKTTLLTILVGMCLCWLRNGDLDIAQALVECGIGGIHAMETLMLACEFKLCLRACDHFDVVLRLELYFLWRLTKSMSREKLSWKCVSCT